MFTDSWGYTIKTRVGFKKFYNFFVFCRLHLPFIFATKSLVNFYTHVLIYEKNFVKLPNLVQLFLNFFFFSKTYSVNTIVVLYRSTLHRFNALPGFVLWNSHADSQPVFNPFVNPGEVKYKFLGNGSGDFLKTQFYKILYKYKNLGLVVLTKFSYYLNTKLFCKNNVITNNFLTTPKFSSSSINKYIDLNNLAQYQFQYLRKNKVYNKGRYSRNRQNYRTGVYMCLYLSVISIFGLYYSFYKFAFKFTYLWWFFIAFVGSFIFPKAVKYRLYEPVTILKKFFDLYVWFVGLVKPMFEKISKYL